VHALPSQQNADFRNPENRAGSGSGSGLKLRHRMSYDRAFAV
jgi:hypothetical protein